MNKELLSIALSAILLIGCIAVGVAATDDVATFEALQTTVNAGVETIKLTANIGGNEPLTIAKNVTLDLNGFDITCPVKVTGGTLYCMDSQTDDYTVEDAYSYGKLTNATGAVKAVSPENDGHGYIMVAENGVLSFHRVNLDIYEMALRPNTAGIYYKCDFAGDEVVNAQIKEFGIAMSIRGMPNLETINDTTKCLRSKFTAFNAGPSNNNATSTILNNIMKTENSDLSNYRNANLTIYGRSYIYTTDGEFILGDPVQRSLREQVELTANDYWDEYRTNESIIYMYRNFINAMRSWDVHNIESALCIGDDLTDGKTLKLLAITSSFGKNTTEFLYDVAIAQGYENITVARLYASGCSLEKHVNNLPTDNNPIGGKIYQYTRISNVEGDIGKRDDNQYTTINNTALSEVIENEAWDIIFIQQGAGQSPQLSTYKDYIDTLRNYINPFQQNAKFVWNMLWSYDWDRVDTTFENVFNQNQIYMYECNANAVLKKIVPRTDFDRIIPTGTVVQNARTYYSQLPNNDLRERDERVGATLCHDAQHLNNAGKVMAAYGLFAVLTGQEWTEETFTKVPEGTTWSQYWYRTIAGTQKGSDGNLRLDKDGDGKTDEFRVVYPTDEDIPFFIESINNALHNPFEVTQTKYTP